MLKCLNKSLYTVLGDINIKISCMSQQSDVMHGLFAGHPGTWDHMLTSATLEVSSSEELEWQGWRHVIDLLRKIIEITFQASS